MKKRIIYFLLVISFMIITLYVFLTSEELEELPKLLTRTNRSFLFVAILLMILYLLINTSIILILGRNVNKDFNFKKALFISFVGQYYSLITPFASGGQPMQVVSMKNKFNVPYTKGTIVTIKKFIVFQISVTMYALILFVLKYNLIFMNQKEILPFTIIGLLVNLLSTLFIIILAYNDAIIKSIICIIINISQRFKIFKRINKDKIYYHIAEYSETISDMKNNKPMMFKLFLLTFMQLTCYFSITYFIYLSLGFGEAHFVDILTIQTVLYVVVSFIPTPGSAGASESGFYVLFGMFFSKNVLLYAMLLWRVIVYYGLLFISGIVVLIEILLRKKHSGKE